MIKHLKIVVLTIIMLVFSIGNVFSQADQLSFKHITEKQNLSSNTVLSILQDSRGFMWFATSVGLCRYDGYRIKVYLTDPSDSISLSGNFTYSNLIEDIHGNLWIGTLSNGLNRYNRSTETFTRFKHDADDEASLSHNKVHTILEDRSGIIWVGTDSGLNMLNDSIEYFNHYLPEDNSPEHPANKILSLFEDSEGELWVGTGEGVYTFDRNKKIFHIFNPKIQPSEEITNKSINAIHEDLNGTLWFGTSWGLFKYDRNIPKLFHLFPDEMDDESLSNNSINHIYEDPFYKGEYLWISSDWGLNKLDIKSGKVSRIYHDPDDPSSIGSNSIHATYIDKNGRLWLATEHAGISYTDFITNRFNYIHIEPSQTDATGYTATTFIEDEKGNLLVGTIQGGLFKYNTQLQLISSYEDDIFDKNSLGWSFIFNLVLEPDNNLLISTYGNGLFRLNLLSSDLESYSFRNKDSIFLKPIIREVYEDSQGYIWVGTKEGLYFSKDNSERLLQLIDNTILGTNQIHALCEDKLGGFWVGTIGQGLFYLPAENRNTLEFIQFKNETGDRNSLSNDLISCITEDLQGQLWIGTGDGLNRFEREDNSFIRYFSREVPGANFVIYITEDNSGYLWMNTQAGLVRFSPNRSGEHQFRVYSIDDGLPFDDIYPHFSYFSNDSRMFIGGKQESGNGFFWFYPDSLKENSQIPPIAITEFKVRNEAISLDSSINEIEQINLSYHQNYFSFEFSALNFINPEKNQYAYKLEGLDNDWIYSGTRRFVSYSGIKPGNYVFRVRGSNNDGYWNDTGKSIRISISPPRWKTWWAYSLYVLFIVGLIYAWRRYDLNRQRLKQELKFEHVESKKLKELDSMKSRFFANISHEFRTPLTLILGPVEKIMVKIKDKNTLQDLHMVQRNAWRLQKLINQLLSLSKLESGKLKLQTKEVNIISVIRSYVQSFESLANQKRIILNFKSDPEYLPLYVDQDKIEQILNNLLSNAFKFTTEGGRIEVSIRTNQTVTDKVSIEVSDTGSGISEDKLSHIFDRFYQVDDSHNKEHEGTGIGLALTKELVELHYGTIKVESRLGKGTIFIVSLLKGKDHLKPEEIIELGAVDVPKYSIKESVKHGDQFTEPGILKSFIEDENDDTKPLLLIVEDNDDMRSYIQSFLTTKYRLIEAINGEMGLHEAIEKIPDLVISDIMMPKMDGIELCRRLKTDERTSHIPVILLTAKASMEDRLEGLETGADDFITKPFDSQELQVRVNNLVEQRRKLREIFSKEIESLNNSPLFQVPNIGISLRDKKFLLKAVGVIDQHLSDPDFSVVKFGQDMAVSHMQLHRKLKALTDQSSSQFIRRIRLIRAANLLHEGSGNVTEIAFDVGFNNLSYFSKCFKEQYGCLPSEFASDNHQNKK